MLSDREIQVLNLAKIGYSNWKIGHELGITTNTVKRHFTNIYRAIGAKNRAHAVYLAISLSYI